MAKKLTLTEAVEVYLGLACEHPEKEPRTQRAQRDNEMLILGFNKAQETLRGILAQSRYPQLADTRADGQRRPEKVGDRNLWIVG